MQVLTINDRGKVRVKKFKFTSLYLCLHSRNNKTANINVKNCSLTKC